MSQPGLISRIPRFLDRLLSGEVVVEVVLLLRRGYRNSVPPGQEVRLGLAEPCVRLRFFLCTGLRWSCKVLVWLQIDLGKGHFEMALVVVVAEMAQRETETVHADSANSDPPQDKAELAVMDDDLNK